MKIQPSRFLLGIAVSLFATAFCQADYETKFNAPPYEIGKTIVGVDGWASRTGNGSKVHGIMVSAPWNSANTVLQLQGSTDTSEKVRVRNASFAPFSNQAKVVAGMAFDFDPSVAGQAGSKSTFAFVDLASIVSPVSFGLDYTANGGLFYAAHVNTTTPNQVTILSKNEIKMNSVYEFTLSMNLEQRTFDIHVTGVKADDSLFSYTATSIAMGAFKDDLAVINTLYVENMGPASSTMYFNHAGIYAIPEPGSVALVLGGGLVALFVAIKRQGRGIL